jgi:beta-glucosidase-like glycosyl hydrolase
MNNSTRTCPFACLIVLLLSLFAPSQAWVSSDDPWVAETLKKMTLEEKIGQMLVPTMSSVFMNQESDSFQQIKKNVTEFQVGGLHAFGGDPAALALLTNRMQEAAKVPLLMTADLEGGAGYQLRGATRLPRAMAIGATADERLASDAGKITAIEGRALGIHINFYPVVDVNNNPRNPIVNIRSFGEDVSLVSAMAAAYIRGAQDNGQLATAKHFPGHGDTSQDSHLELAVVDVDWDRLNRIELPPFRAAVKGGVAAVMTAHIALPQIEPDKGLPATLSPKIITDILRKDIGFDGLVFTDAMDMRGVSAHYEPGEAALRAVNAGADIILFPVDLEKSFNAIKHAAQSGQLSLSRIETSARRILAAKARLGLHRNRLVDLNKLDTIVGSAEHQQKARSIIEQAITLVRDQKHTLPLKLGDGQRVLCLTILDSRQGWREGFPGAAFRAELRKRHPKTIDVDVDENTSNESFGLIRKLADVADVIIVNGFIRVAAYKGTIDLTDGQLNLLKHLSTLNKPFVFTLFGSPYLLTFVPELPTYILAYEYYPGAEAAALRAILGEIPFKGKLPISLPGLYPIGHGLAASSTTP